MFGEAVMSTSVSVFIIIKIVIEIFKLCIDNKVHNV